MNKSGNSLQTYQSSCALDYDGPQTVSGELPPDYQYMELKPGDHLCLLYEKHEEFLQTILAYFKTGLKLKQKCLYLANHHTTAEVTAYLQGGGLDVHKYISQGQLVIMDSQQPTLDNSHRFVENNDEFLIRETNQAIAEGFSCLRFSTELVYTSGQGYSTKGLINYEARLNSTFTDDYPCIIMCQYNIRQFTGNILKDIMQIHPLLVWQNRVLDNCCYYIPPHAFMSSDRNYSQAILWLEHLKSHRNRQRDIEESEARYRALVDLGAEVGESILMAQNIGDKEGAIIFASDQFSKLTGYSNRELLAKSLFEFVSPQDREQVLSRYRRKMSGISLPGLYELHIIKKDGNQIPVEITSTVTRYQGKPTDVVYLRDITQRKNIEQQIKNSEYRLRALSRRIIDSQESERILLSRELHDQCGQELVALRLGIISLLEKYRHQDDSARLHTMINCVDNLIDTVHNLSSSLRPGMLDDLGLVNTLQWLAQDFQKRTGIECNVRLPKDQLNGIYINTDISLVAYRIVQEALTNVAKHAQASLAEISIALRKQDLRVCVTDNGIGISRKKTTGRLCLGLMGMQERASIVGGTIRIRRLHNNGTRVCFTSPLDIPAGNLLSQGEGCL